MASWQGKMCPLLSMAALMKPSPVVKVVGQTSEPEVLGCQGPACMFFTPLPGQELKGNQVPDGACSPALVPHAISQLVVATQAITTSKGN